MFFFFLASKTNLQASQRRSVQRKPAALTAFVHRGHQNQQYIKLLCSCFNVQSNTTVPPP